MTVNLAVLGSTGSIGRQTLDVARAHPNRFNVVALAGGANLDLLEQQVREFEPSLVSTSTPCDTDRFSPCRALCDDEGLLEVATFDDADIVVVATSGHSAIRPTLAAIRAGKQIALANKEVVVCAGEILMPAARDHGIEIRPVDSEHSAIWQCLMSSQRHEEVATITLTASGGALRTTPLTELKNVTAEQALAHPNWKMGQKITIDSATLMNKGLELIEAHWLFNVGYDTLDVVVHPQSIVHSLVSFVDGSVVAQLGIPDMRVPIQYALTYPERVDSPGRQLSIVEMGTLEFYPPDLERYPALTLATQAGEAGSTYPTVLSAADEVAVEAFLRGKIRFAEIIDIVRATLDDHVAESAPITLDAIDEADQWARSHATSTIEAVRYP